MNIREFAALCGVSSATASRILNNPLEASGAAHATYQLVRKKAEELGFRPNYAAKSLHTKKSNCLGAIFGYPSMVNTTAFVRGIGHAVFETGLSLAITDCQNDPRKEIKAFNEMLYRGVDAIIWQPVFQRHTYSTRYIQKTVHKVTQSIPVVSLSNVPIDGIFRVCANAEEDAINAAQRQLRLGCKKFVLLRSAFCYHTNEVTNAAYLAELKRNGIAEKNMRTLIIDERGNMQDPHIMADAEGVLIYFPFMLHALLPVLRQHCDLKQLHIDGQSFVEDYSITQWTYRQSTGTNFEDLFGSLQYHLLDCAAMALRGGEMALEAINNPGLTPYTSQFSWMTPPFDFRPGEVLFSSNPVSHLQRAWRKTAT